MKKLFAIMSTMLLLASCAEVTLCDTTEEDHPHTTWMSIDYDLANMYSSESYSKIDTMIVLAYRVVNQWRSMLKTDVYGRGNFVNTNVFASSFYGNTDGRHDGYHTVQSDIILSDADATRLLSKGKTLAQATADDITPAESTTPTVTPTDSTAASGKDSTATETETTPAQTTTAKVRFQPGVPMKNDSTSFCIKPGDYRFYSLSYDTTEVDYRNMYQYVENQENTANIRPSDLNAIYRQHRRNSPELRNKIDNWDDYNAYAYYIQPDIAPVYYGETDITTMERGDNKSVKVSIVPTNELQQVDVNFSIEKDISSTLFVVDSVWMDLSGIPYRVGVSNGHLDITYTSKTMKKMTVLNSGGTEGDSMNNIHVKCTATLHTNGVVRPYDSEEGKNDARQRVYGPGLLQAIIFTHSNQPLGTTGKMQGKRFQCMVNLYDALTDSPSVIVSDDGTYYSQYTKHCIINIQNVIPLNGKHITVSPDNEGGVKNWQEWQPTSESDLIIEI